jgi:S-adenosylmethionine decarboxylase proenzyme
MNALKVTLIALLPFWAIESIAEITQPSEILHLTPQNVENHVNTETGGVIRSEFEFEEWLGTSVMAEIVNVSNEQGLLILKNATLLEELIVEAAQQSNLTILHSVKHQFHGKGEGATAQLTLAESHLAVHSWPEHNYLAVDLFTCSQEYSAKYAIEYIRTKLQGDVFVSGRLPRGIPSQNIVNQHITAPSAAVLKLERLTKQNVTVDATLSEIYADMLNAKDIRELHSLYEIDENSIILDSISSEFQNIEFIQMARNNDICLVLDGTTQICSSYSKHYTDVYVHLPAAFLDALHSVLIIGGGDAFALEEVLKYKSVEKVVQLELDRMVPELCEKHFGVNAHLPPLKEGEATAVGGTSNNNNNKTTDPRVEWRFGDAAVTIEELFATGQKFDIILLDISETGPSGTVSTLEFFQQVSRLLSPRGIFIKNEHYLEATATLFNEFLEVKYPVPVISQQVFVLGSNQTSLLVPSFTVLEENGIKPAFLANGPADRYRQFTSMVRRYSKRNVDYEIALMKKYEAYLEDKDDQQQQQRMVMMVGSSNDVEGPCYQEALNDPDTVPISMWRDTACQVPLDEAISIVLTNNSPDTVTIATWITVPSHVDDDDDVGEEGNTDRHHDDDSDSDNDNDNEDAQQFTELVADVQPGQSVLLEVVPLTSVVAVDAQTMASLGTFKVTSQLATHPYVVYYGLSTPMTASRMAALCDPRGDKG